MSDDQVAPRERVAKVISSVWWIMLLRGMLLIVLGGYALLQPGLTLVTFTQVLGAFVLIDGLFAIVAGVMGWTESRWWTLLRGVLGILVGAFVFAHPLVVGIIAASIVACIIGFQSIVAGVLEIMVAIRERKEIEGEGWWILNGVLSILFGVLVVMLPFASSLVMIRVIGSFAMLFGIAVIVNAFRLRSVGKKITAS